MVQASRRKFHVIYKTTCLLNSKFYIGMHSTDNLDDGYFGSGKRIKYSLNKHGKENHVTEILEFCESREQLRLREAHIINDEFLLNEKCLNIIKGGGVHEWSEHSRRKLSNSNKGRKHSEETKLKMSLASKERPKSEAHRKSISTNQKGRKLTTEWKENISKGLVGKIVNFKRSIVIDGIEYESTVAASLILNIKKTTIGKRLISKNFINYFYKED